MQINCLYYSKYLFNSYKFVIVCKFHLPAVCFQPIVLPFFIGITLNIFKYNFHFMVP